MGDVSKFIEEQAGNQHRGEKQPREQREKVELSDLAQVALAELEKVISTMAATIPRPEALVVVRKFTHQVRRAYSGSADVKKKRLQDQIARLQKKLEGM